MTRSEQLTARVAYLQGGGLEMVPDMVKQFVVYFYRHIRCVVQLQCSASMH